MYIRIVRVMCLAVVVYFAMLCVWGPARIIVLVAGPSEALQDAGRSWGCEGANTRNGMWPRNT